MKLVNCSTCGKEVAPKAKVCPGCGARLYRSKFWRVIIALFLAVFVIPSLVQMSMSSGVPDCDSPNSIGLAKDYMNEKIANNGVNMQLAAIDRDSDAQVLSDEVIDISDAQEVSYDEGQKVRVCKGIAQSKLTGKVNVSYTFKLLNDGDIYIEASANR